MTACGRSEDLIARYLLLSQSTAVACGAPRGDQRGCRSLQLVARDMRVRDAETVDRCVDRRKPRHVVKQGLICCLKGLSPIYRLTTGALQSAFLSNRRPSGHRSDAILDEEQPPSGEPNLACQARYGKMPY